MKGCPRAFVVLAVGVAGVSDLGQKRHELCEAPSTPKADKRATVHIDGELKERFDAYGTGTHKEKINQLLYDADRAKTLEAKVIELER